ncbi:hypothetical protein [Leptothermofonsia sp. ETS-13]|uniref:hypothetical protein n=1 Tax=Leptothermofonsia sp. ETS-13 TaxID=3035696 RepID=UPI003BA002F1
MQNWFPLPRSWVIAIVVVLLMAGCQHLSGYLWWLISWLINFFPKFIYIFYLLITFSPIVLIAFLHHWLHQLLDQFFPESQLPGSEPVQGSFPSLISWWEGFYSWVVNHLSAILSWALLGLFLPFPTQVSIMQFSPWSLSYLLNRGQPLWLVSLSLQIVFAAYFYEFEYAVQRRWVMGRE